MEERRNNISVEKRMKDKLKSDRARIQVGRISGFGLMEMSRQRLRPGMLEATTKECPHCLGTGLERSDDTQALSNKRETIRCNTFTFRLSISNASNITFKAFSGSFNSS